MTHDDESPRPDRSRAFRAQCVMAAGFAVVALVAWWSSGTAPDVEDTIAGQIRALTMPALLAAVCATVNALALHRGRTLSLMLRASPMLVFLAALVSLRLLG
ncbi:hypothetical protein [Agrilutibacter solisilvae]|uniref:Uncharacterized protein n=1 Tax=Agrilutibacter solisilvae TaxID=2763317 RepID=A0A974Y2D7_9GAMM|nr:hypothetical protein [Lysobacter solisilvae]QSX79325.1 hypothetical protein I8J32_005495 [Lysobacter solisilvae]